MQIPLSLVPDYKSETAGYIIEKLNEKTIQYYDSIEQFCNFDLPQTKGQAEWNQTFLELYIFPLPFDAFKFKEFYSSNFFKNTAYRFYQNIEVNLADGKEPEINKQVAINLGFNSIYSSERSLIIRPLNEHNLIYKSTTAELFENGNFKFLIPLMEFNAENIPKKYSNSNTLNFLLDKYSPYETYDEYRHYTYPRNQNFEPSKISKRISSDFVKHIKFIDGAELILRILIIISQFKSILSDNDFNFQTKFGFRAKITDCWRKFVFFDDDDYLEKIKLYNIPLSPKSSIEIPKFTRGDLYVIDLSDDHVFFLISKFILEGIGLPDSQDINFGKIVTEALDWINKQQ